MNYSETYFELDSEEATHCHLICCVYIKGIKGHVETVNTKDQSNAIVYGMFVTLLIQRSKHANALIAIFVETVDTQVFVALTQHPIQSTIRCVNSTLLCIKWPLAP